MTPGELARVLPRIDKTAECWLWTGAKSDGYGQVKREGAKKLGRVHRLMYEHYVGPIPETMELDHLCRTRACVRPDHLQQVTTRENVLRGEGLAAANARKTHCPRGHKLVGENLVVATDGSRECRACHNAANRQYLRAYRRRPENRERAKAYARDWRRRRAAAVTA